MIRGRGVKQESEKPYVWFRRWFKCSFCDWTGNASNFAQHQLGQGKAPRASLEISKGADPLDFVPPILDLGLVVLVQLYA